MLFGPMKESTSSQVKLGDDRLTVESFKAFLEYIYVGEVNLTASTVFGLGSLAKLYDFGELLVDVNKFSKSSLTPENCLDVICEASNWPEVKGES